MICPWQEKIRYDYDCQENSEKKHLSGWQREPELGRKFAAENAASEPGEGTYSSRGWTQVKAN